MPAFQLFGIPHEPFAALFRLSDPELAQQNARRVIADADVGYPCRISLEDAAVGDELLLMPYQHLATASPYRASGPIFVRRGAIQRVLPPDEVPLYVSRRLMSLRAYDAGHLMLSGEIIEGPAVADALHSLFERPDVTSVHLHNAGRGCFSCIATRA